MLWELNDLGHLGPRTSDENGIRIPYLLQLKGYSIPFYFSILRIGVLLLETALQIGGAPLFVNQSATLLLFPRMRTLQQIHLETVTTRNDHLCRIGSVFEEVPASKTLEGRPFNWRGGLLFFNRLV